MAISQTYRRSQFACLAVQSAGYSRGIQTGDLFARSAVEAVDRHALLPLCYPQIHRKLADRGCVRDPSQLWINLWKLWIAPFSCVLRHAYARCGACWARLWLCYGPSAPPPIAWHLLGWSGDSGVLPVRHPVECARTTAHLVPTLPGRPDGAAGRRASG